MRVIVTGGRSDIGQAIILRRLGMGDSILTTASSEPTLDDLRDKFKDQKNLECCQWDMSTPSVGGDKLEGFISEGLGALILNAAAPTRALKRFHELSDEEIQQDMQTQISGNLWLIKRCLPKMVEQNFGRIVFVSSIAIYGTSRYSMYALAKSGIEGLLRVVATDYGEFNITANMVRPGIIATARNKRFWSRSDYMNLMTEIIPSKSLGQPLQIAEAMDPFLSVNCYANGASLDVAGGLPNMRSDYFLKVQKK